MNRFKNLKNSFCLNAFTLAEVLITLGIIGIVAAMTIPTLMQNTGDRANKEAFRKTYSAISQATLQMITDNGGTLTDALPVETTNYWGDSYIYQQYAKYLGIAKVCGNNASNPTTDCFPYTASKNASTTYNHAPNSGTFADAALLKDGQGIRFDHAVACDSTTVTCARIWVDTNGPNKKPNVWGRDIFMIDVFSNHVAPRGWDMADTACTTGNGEGCARFVISNTDYD